MGRAAVKGLFQTILIVITLILSGVTIVAAYAGHYSPADSVIMPILGLSLPVLLIVNLIASLYWAISRKWLALVPLFAFFFNWNYLTAVIQFNSIKKNDVTTVNSNSISKVLTIATYNIHSFGKETTGYSCKELAKYMKNEGVDIICFQEFEDNQYFPLDSICRILAHWQYISIPQKDSIRGRMSIALFSRHPIINQQFIPYPDSPNCSMLCDIIVNRDTVRIINNHLQTTSVSQNRKKWELELSSRDTHRKANAVKGAVDTLYNNSIKRATQVDSICQLIDNSPYPVIACGDLNSLPSSYVYHQLSQRLQDGFRTSGRGYMYTFRYYKRLLRIDYIFHSSRFEGMRYYSPNLELCSDHNPVLMKMRIK